MNSGSAEPLASATKWTSEMITKIDVHTHEGTVRAKVTRKLLNQKVPALMGDQRGFIRKDVEDHFFVTDLDRIYEYMVEMKEAA